LWGTVSKALEKLHALVHHSLKSLQSHEWLISAGFHQNDVYGSNVVVTQMEGWGREGKDRNPKLYGEGKTGRVYNYYRRVEGTACM